MRWQASGADFDYSKGTCIHFYSSIPVPVEGEKRAKRQKRPVQSLVVPYCLTSDEEKKESVNDEKRMIDVTINNTCALSLLP